MILNSCLHYLMLKTVSKWCFDTAAHDFQFLRKTASMTQVDSVERECTLSTARSVWWDVSSAGGHYREEVSEDSPPRSTVADYKTNDSVNTFDAAGIASPQHRDYDLHKSYKLTTGSKYKVHDQKISEREYLYLLLINTFKQTRDRHL